MKKSLFSSLAFVSLFFLTQVKAQTASVLTGMRVSTTNDAVFNSLNTGSGAFADIATLEGIKHCVQGETTFDPVHRRQFFSDNQNIITVVDAVTGYILQQIPNTIKMRAYEYNILTGTLIGVYWNGTIEKLVSLDLTTETFTDLGTLPGVTGIAQGESALDVVGGRYFIRPSYSEILVISLVTNSIIETIEHANGFNSIEYDPGSNSLIGWYQYGSRGIITSVNLDSKVFHDIGGIDDFEGAAQGESSFDAANQRYFIQTIDAILTINAQTAEIIESCPSNVNMHMIEFNRTVEYNPNSNCTVFPNPFSANSVIQLEVPVTDAALILYDINGKKIKTIAHLSGDYLKIEREGLPKGIYYFNVVEQDKVILKSKFVITD